MATRKDHEDETGRELVEAARHLKDAIERAEAERQARLEAERLREYAEAQLVKQQHETERLLKQALEQVKVEEEQTRNWKRTASQRLKEATALADRESMARLAAERQRDEALARLKAAEAGAGKHAPELQRLKKEAEEELTRERSARQEAERLRAEAESRRAEAELRLKSLEQESLRQQTETERLLKEAAARLSQERQSRLEAERQRDEADGRWRALEDQLGRHRPETDRLLREEAARLAEERQARLAAERLRDQAEARRREAELARLEAERLREQAEARQRSLLERPAPEPRRPALEPAPAPERTAPSSVGRFILTPAASGFPWLATKEASGYVNQPEGARLRGASPEPLFVLVHLDRDVESLELRVIDAEDGHLRGVASELRAVPRSAAANSFLALPWQGTILGRALLGAASEAPSPLPPGSYRLVVRAAVGGGSEPHYDETWTSPVVTVAAS